MTKVNGNIGHFPPFCFQKILAVTVELDVIFAA